MAQLKEDEWPADREETTIEQQVARDPEHGPKDPDDPRHPEASEELRSGRMMPDKGKDGSRPPQS